VRAQREACTVQASSAGLVSASLHPTFFMRPHQHTNLTPMSGLAEGIGMAVRMTFGLGALEGSNLRPAD